MTVQRVELHTHLEGSVTPERLIGLARKYGQPGLPLACLTADGTGFAFDGFRGFLDLYKHATSVMREPSDFHALALDLGGQLAADEVAYAEVSVSYAVLLVRGIDPLPVQTALHEAALEVAETSGVQMRWLPDAVRQFEEKWAWRAWEKAAQAGRKLGVVGLGLGGDETNGPARRYARLFAEVKAEGFGVSIHAGELPAMGPAALASVREAVEECGADRIGHGLAAAGDPLLLATLAARNVFVELCPGSNLLTGGVKAWRDFPLAAFMEAGVPCALNTDDRTMFGLTLRGEYARAAAELGLTPALEAAQQAAAARAAFEPAISSGPAAPAGARSPAG
jgi:adenosine deaminase